MTADTSFVSVSFCVTDMSECPCLIENENIDMICQLSLTGDTVNDMSECLDPLSFPSPAQNQLPLRSRREGLRTGLDGVGHPAFSPFFLVTRTYGSIQSA